MELNIPRLIYSVNVSEPSCNREVWRNRYKCIINFVDILRLSVESSIVDTSIVNTILFTTSDTNFLLWVVSRSQQHVENLGHTISIHCFIGAALSTYFLVKAMFSSLDSSDKSIMWLEKSGSPCFLKYSSSASIIPSSHGRSFLAQWSEWRTTGIPYTGAILRI